MVTVTVSPSPTLTSALLESCGSTGAIDTNEYPVGSGRCSVTRHVVPVGMLPVYDDVPGRTTIPVWL